MDKELKRLIIQSLEDQKEIFGDDFVKIRRTEVNEKSWQDSETLDELNKLICDCTKCPLGLSRNKFVFGEGNPHAEVLLIGEGPGADEDMQGRPFVGKAGQLLDKIIESINFKREEVFIANIVKCRPPQNRVPMPEEVQSCIPYLHKQISLLQPKVILCLGLTAANNLFNRQNTLAKWRGSEYDFMGAKVMVTYHPAALLRNPNWKRGCWEDVKLFRKMYDRIKAEA